MESLYMMFDHLIMLERIAVGGLVVAAVVTAMVLVLFLRR